MKKVLVLAISVALAGCSTTDVKTEKLEVNEGWEALGMLELAQTNHPKSEYQSAHSDQGIAKEAALPKRADPKVVLWIRHGANGEMKIYQEKDK